MWLYFDANLKKVKLNINRNHFKLNNSASRIIAGYELKIYVQNHDTFGGIVINNNEFILGSAVIATHMPVRLIRKRIKFWNGIQ